MFKPIATIVCDILKRLLLVTAVLVLVVCAGALAHGQVNPPDMHGPDTIPGVCLTGRGAKLADAIARTEGYYVHGSIPNRYRNPGDLRASKPNAYPGQIGLYHHYAVFASDAFGWAALCNQIQKVVDGTSHRFDAGMTFREFGRVYAASPQWSVIVCKILHVSSSITLAEYLGVDHGRADELRTLRVPQVPGMWIVSGLQARLR